MKASTALTLLVSAFFAISCAQEPKAPYADCMDISHYQGRIDWDEVVKDTLGFTCIYSKVTESDWYVDTTYRYNLPEARRHGYKVGGYHYYRQGASAHANFENFRREYNSIEFDLKPMLDIERNDDYTPEQMVDSLKTYCELIKEEYGVYPVIYSTEDRYNSLYKGMFTDSFLFIGKVEGGEPVLEDGGVCKLWQFCWTAKVRGVEFEADISRFTNGGSIEDILMK